jgi:predicted ArsR family transcriptional regulator
VTPELHAISFPDRHYEALIGLTIDAMPSTGRKQRLRSIGAAYAEELARGLQLRPARSLRAGVEAMCGAMRSLGFQAAVEEVGEDRAVISTPTCPLRPVVVEHPDAAEIDRGMWSGLAAHTLAGVSVADVECETRDCLVDHASCRVLINLRSTRRRAGPAPRHDRPAPTRD